MGELGPCVALYGKGVSKSLDVMGPEKLVACSLLENQTKRISQYTGSATLAVLKGPQSQLRYLAMGLV